MDYAITLVAAVLLGVGFVLQQRAAQEAPKSDFLRPRLLLDLLRKRQWLAGIAVMVAGQVLAGWSLGHLALGVVEPLLTTNLLVALALAVPLSGEALRVTEAVGALLLIGGETALSLARIVTPIGLSFGSSDNWPAAAAIALVAFAAVRAGRRRGGSWRATLTGVGAGLVFGIQDALTRQSLVTLETNSVPVLLATWAPYCLVATAAVGIWLMQSAFNSGPLHASLGPITAGEPVVGILLGILVFGDRIQLSGGSLAMQVAGIAALVVGVILVARAPALTGLKTAVDQSIPHLEHHVLPVRDHDRPPRAERTGDPELNGSGTDESVSADTTRRPGNGGSGSGDPELNGSGTESQVGGVDAGGSGRDRSVVDGPTGSAAGDMAAGRPPGRRAPHGLP